MLFIPPFDQIGATPPGPWTNAAPQAGVQGSIVNADVFPAVQNEILAIIAADPNLTASATDLGQAQKSIAYQIATAIAALSDVIRDTAADTSTNAAEIIATATPAATTRQAGLGYIVFPAHACAGATTINVGFGAENLTRNDATALQSGDYAAGQPLVVIDDGTRFRIADLTISQVEALIPAATSTVINNMKIVGSTPHRFASAGSFTLAVAANVSFSISECRGAGGGGGGASGPGFYGSGGAGGGNAVKVATATSATVLAITVGAPGPGGTAGGGNGSSGGTTSVSVQSGSVVDINGTTFTTGQTLCAATGGTGGTGAASSNPTTAGVGGAASGGDLNDTGDNGGLGVSLGSNSEGGEGGSSPGSGGSPQPGIGAGNSSTSSGTGGSGGSQGSVPGGAGTVGRVTIYK